MEDEISIGEYVRTEYGIIDKVKDIRNTYGERKLVAYENANTYTSEIGLKNIAKQHGKNLKDILQIGDIIRTNNLCGEITKIDGDIIYLANYMGICNIRDIKSIITKEQIKQIEYRIKE